jgi:hypothetical protein
MKQLYKLTVLNTDNLSSNILFEKKESQETSVNRSLLNSVEQSDLNLKKSDKIDEILPSWEDLEFNDKARLFSYWNILIMIGDISVFLG